MEGIPLAREATSMEILNLEDEKETTNDTKVPNQIKLVTSRVFAFLVNIITKK